MRECTAIIHTLKEYEFLIIGSKHPTVYRFQLILMIFPYLHIAWTAGKNLALPDTLSKNRPPELLTRKTTVEIPQN